MECDFIITGIDDEPDRTSGVVPTGWESVVFEVEDVPDDAYFVSSDC
jgi:hypothetical protein